jgi:alpha-beta hydrolase superfamily lysophospholipase
MLDLCDVTFHWESNVDRLALQGYAWRARGAAPRAALVLAHGAGEHALRYARFARALSAEGIEVIAFDQRGHGRSPGPSGLGDPGKAGWNGLVDDLRQLVERARDDHRDLPLALFGHSMGSLLAQQLCHGHASLLDAVILSGSTAIARPGPGETLPSSPPNAAFEPARTPYDWLSRDASEVDAYIADPLCGIRPGIARLFSPEVLFGLSDPQELARMRPDLPVLFVAGDADPLNRKLEALHLLERLWRKAGVRRIDTRYYSGGRHEMLNETNRDEVTRDIIQWLHTVM